MNNINKSNHKITDYFKIDKDEDCNNTESEYSLINNLNLDEESSNIHDLQKIVKKNLFNNKDYYEEKFSKIHHHLEIILRYYSDIYEKQFELSFTSNFNTMLNRYTDLISKKNRLYGKNNAIFKTSNK